MNLQCARNTEIIQTEVSVTAKYLDAFCTIWRNLGKPPILSKFVPDERETRTLFLKELIKIDLEFRYSVFNFPRKIEEYFVDFPELYVKDIAIDLIYEEYHWRFQAGLDADPNRYLARFPDYQKELAGLFALGDRRHENIEYSTDLRDELQIGERIDDFDLLADIGHGAYARVFLANQQSMQRRIALKISRNAGAEPQILAKLDHQNIVRVFDYRRITKRNLCLLSMEYLSGDTLKKVISIVKQTEVTQRRGSILLQAVSQNQIMSATPDGVPCPDPCSLANQSWADTVCWLGAQLARALDYAHGKGVLHLDIKPANVLLTAEAKPKLADFNISIQSDHHQDTDIGGSLAYMSPEQLLACKSSEWDRQPLVESRSDLYSLGVLLWELASGNRPFSAIPTSAGWSDAIKAMVRQRRRNIPSGNKLSAETNPRLVYVLKKCIAPNVEERWSSGSELAHQLELCRNTKALKMLYPKSKRIRRGGVFQTLLVLFLIAAIPNMLAGWFSCFYNCTQIMLHQTSITQTKIWCIQMFINGGAYPLGLMIFLRRAYPIARAAFRSCSASTGFDDRFKRHCLQLGRLAATTCLQIWAFATILYLVIVYATIGEIPLAHFPHFILTMLFCGLIAAPYPYFGITAFSIRKLYPLLIRDRFSPTDRESLLKLKKQSSAYLFAATVIPMCAVLASAVTGTDTNGSLIVLSACSVFGVAILFQLFRQTQKDANTLIEAIN